MNLFITQQTEVLTFHHADEILEVLPLTLSMPECWVEFCKMTLTFESVDEILWCDHSNESALPLLSYGAICFSKFYTMKFANLVEIFLWSHLAVKGLDEKLTNSASLTLNTLLSSATQSGIHRVESRIQGCPGFSYMGQILIRKNKFSRKRWCIESKSSALVTLAEQVELISNSKFCYFSKYGDYNKKII